MLNGARIARIALTGIDGFAAITAIAGGIALALGLEGERFPTAWLSGTPFGSYLMPGLILAGLVGGSAAVATALTMRDPGVGGRASIVAGAVMAGWIIGEILMIGADGQLISPAETLYLVVGATMATLGYAVQHEARPRTEDQRRAQ